HITDLRELAQPRSVRFLRAYALVSGDGSFKLTSTGENGAAWPEPQDLPSMGAWRVDVPEWAQRVRVICQWAGVRFQTSGGNAYGGVWGRIGSISNSAGISTQETQWDTADRSGIYREVLVA